MNATEAFARLGLTPDASPANVHDRFRQLAKTAHPDGGGSIYAYDDLVKARIAAMRHVMDALCPDCAGTGRVLLARGWQSCMLPCARCGETGKLHPPKKSLDDSTGKA